MQKRTRSSQPQLSLLARHQNAPGTGTTGSPEHRRELLRNLAELLLEAARSPIPTGPGDEESSYE